MFVNIVKRTVRGLIRGLGYEVKRIATVSSSSCHKKEEANLGIPSVPLRDLLNGDVKICLLEPEQVNGNVSLQELVVINILINRYHAKTIFEIGTFDGRTTLNMAANAGPGARVYTLDLPRADVDSASLPLDAGDKQFVDKEASRVRFRRTDWEKEIVQLSGDSATFDYGPYTGKVDMVFIDGSHSYDYVKNDTEAALKIVNGSAVIVWHDYQPYWHGVVRYLNEAYARGGIFKDLKHVEDTCLVFLTIGR
jgi:predicted O-methyltransferase YrrM